MAWSLFKSAPVDLLARYQEFASISTCAFLPIPAEASAIEHPMQDCKDKKCPLSRTRHPDYRPMFERHVVRRSLQSHPSNLVYASFGSGLLLQDYQLIQLISKGPALRELSVHLIDALYVPPTADIVEDDDRIHQAVLDFASRVRALSSPTLAVRVLLHPSAASYIGYCKTHSEMADVLIFADCGPEIQSNFLILCERALKPKGHWFVLFKYSDGSKDEITDKKLPTAVAGMLFSRGQQQHCCVISGRQDVTRRPKVFDLQNCASDENLWLHFPPVAEAQKKWEHRNLLNCKIALLAFEHWSYNYTLHHGIPPPRAPLVAACLSSRSLWLQKLLKHGVSATQVIDKASPLHWTVMSAAQPDSVEAEMVATLLKAGADPNLGVPGCGMPGCKCIVGFSTPLHWAAINKAEACCACLLAAGADPNALNQSKHTPLHVACLVQCVPVARLLLAKGSNRDLKDADGDTALAIAELKKNAELIQLLQAPF